MAIHNTYEIIGKSGKVYIGKLVWNSKDISERIKENPGNCFYLSDCVVLGSLPQDNECTVLDLPILFGAKEKLLKIYEKISPHLKSGREIVGGGIESFRKLGSD